MPGEQGAAESLAELTPTDATAEASAADAKATPKASREDINEAAFGAESQAQPGSKGYGQQTKVALGTFAFHREKGDNYRAAGRYKEAAIEYETALRLNPSDVDTRTLYAEVLSRHGNTGAAQEEFEQAKTENPDDARVYYKQGNAYYDQQKYELAIGSYLRAVGLDPQNKFAQNNLGVAYMEKGEYAKAITRFKKVLQIDPNYDMAVLNLGIIYDEHMSDKDEALKYYEKYLTLKGPRTTEVQHWVEALKKQP